MSYCLKTDEGIADGIRRVMREQLQGGLCEISQATPGNEAKAVHATRKHIKKARALLRLVRETIGQKIFQEENRFLREVGRIFASSRDARVRQETLEQLREQIGDTGAWTCRAVVVNAWASVSSVILFACPSLVS